MVSTIRPREAELAIARLYLRASRISLSFVSVSRAQSNHTPWVHRPIFDFAIAPATIALIFPF
ncbi:MULTISPECIES: hypothetical protein [Leptolyngbya]|uniref:hypothetical protein n=1 Tax=Leptolyngbya TaxID=47251 RepID=UPI001181A6CB|nr:MULTISPECIES: hypothetical protein [Leptolyngbya]MBD2369298.1 hypothetical protein [Leptolyngbya sp. FACHB-161]MBD2375700.1 hypothetical protein [Leptolyngbya sp. FACHB-238]MBD2401049.1 hypothetical protein [Leptolyngbya sp. FACHB-239]MBD2406634.1 hypothetical protein [Leptolyngbya sp. FACHB-402]ULP32115.1 hypothetical protein MCP04_10200 [Leptolyngbya boryana IU 594]